MQDKLRRYINYDVQILSNQESLEIKFKKKLLKNII